MIRNPTALGNHTGAKNLCMRNRIRKYDTSGPTADFSSNSQRLDGDLDDRAGRGSGSREWEPAP
ncbi:hypothetical protein BN903_177 [Halorubrum sp. AJ67]|nr:hypothetical protein BN903_177 [Halorubrum sp. AJ67]